MSNVFEYYSFQRQEGHYCPIEGNLRIKNEIFDDIGFNKDFLKSPNNESVLTL